MVYGVLYGQSAEALAPQLGVSRPKAWKIRQTVLKTYPKLKDYLQKVKDDCKKSGWVVSERNCPTLCPVLLLYCWGGFHSVWYLLGRR